MKKKTILSALLLCLAATLHAQTPGNIIYLKKRKYHQRQRG